MKYILLVPLRIEKELPEIIADKVDSEAMEVTTIVPPQFQTHNGFVLNVKDRHIREVIEAAKSHDVSIHALTVPVPEWLKNHGLAIMEE